MRLIVRVGVSVRHAYLACALWIAAFWLAVVARVVSAMADTGSPHANRLVQAAEISEVVTPMGVTPTTERQARALAPLLSEPAQLREAWQEVQELHKQPTAADVREVVERKMDVHYSSASDDWSTPQDLFDTLDAEFGKQPGPVPLDDRAFEAPRAKAEA